MNNHEHHQHSHHGSHGSHGEKENEVFIHAVYQDGKIRIELTDKNQRAPELGINHEKEFHLIVVSNDLSDYRHLHPIQVKKGVFEQAIELDQGVYKLFIDIQPKNLTYHVKPVKVYVDHHANSVGYSLEADKILTKTVNGRTVELVIDSLKVNHPTVFAYDSKDGHPEPYLGALGHVVILDEKGEQFIHVHPSTEESTIFETQFNETGLYKVWGEFKFEGTVHVYPFVVNVTE